MTPVIDTGDKEKLLLGERVAVGQFVQQEESLNIFINEHQGYLKPRFAKQELSSNGKECVILPRSHTSAAEPEERSAWLTRTVTGILQACHRIA